MDKDELTQLLRDNLTIELKDSYESSNRYLIATILFDGEEICSDSLNLP